MNTCTSRLQKVRVTLDFEVYDDFNARQIDYAALFDINGAESLAVCVEELSETYDAMYQQLEDNSL
jgi:hypothetical protein